MKPLSVEDGTKMAGMSDEQRNKILDVMHTLSCIRDGKVVNAKVSAKACWNVLSEAKGVEDGMSDEHKWLGTQEVNDWIIGNCSCGWSYQLPYSGVGHLPALVGYWGDHIRTPQPAVPVEERTADEIAIEFADAMLKNLRHNVAAERERRELPIPQERTAEMEQLLRRLVNATHDEKDIIALAVYSTRGLANIVQDAKALLDHIEGKGK